MLTDAHVHLEQYPPEDLRGVLDRARGAGVAWLVTVGMDLDSSARAVQLAGEHGEVLASVGVHPWAVPMDLPSGFVDAIQKLGAETGVVAIGEVGLDSEDNLLLGIDYRLDTSFRHVQEAAFRRQVEIAVDLGRPLNLHCRGAYPRLLSILAEERSHRSRGVVHNFDGDLRSLSRLLDLGFCVSFGGALTYPHSEAARRAARKVPLDAVLVETDAPYMALHGKSARGNEPANVLKVARALARVRGIEDAEIIEATHENFVALFGLESVPDAT